MVQQQNSGALPEEHVQEDEQTDAKLDSGWVARQLISIPTKVMDQIVADHVSYHRDMDGSSKFLGRRYIATQKGHGFEAKYFGGNVLITRCAREEQ